MTVKNLTLHLLTEVLFCTTLQPSERPDPAAVRRAVARFLLRNGQAFREAAAEVAAQYGDDPEAAIRRLRWSRSLAARAFPEAVDPMPSTGEASAPLWVHSAPCAP